MQSPIKPITAWVAFGVFGMSAAAMAQGPNNASNVISSHQIDRFEAIKELQQSLKSDAKDEADWVILGELAHEVALDLPSDQDDAYYTISRDAYERALQLDPNNAGLRAAVQFARDQEAQAPQLDESRRNGAAAYLAARRREMAISGINPTVRVYTTQPPTVAAQPVAQPDSEPVQPEPAPPSRVLPAPAYQYPVPVYQPYAPAQGQPYTYQQYANSNYPTPNPANANVPANQPTTMRQYFQQLPQVLGNEAIRRVAPQAAPTPR